MKRGLFQLNETNPYRPTYRPTHTSYRTYWLELELIKSPRETFLVIAYIDISRDLQAASGQSSITMASVKTESMIKPDPAIKPDPDAMNALPSAMSDDDMYEDAGDLEFADFSPTNPAAADVYLTFVPKYLYDAWANMDDNEEIRIGTMRKWIEIGKDGRQTVRRNPSLLN